MEGYGGTTICMFFALFRFSIYWIVVVVVVQRASRYFLGGVFRVTQGPDQQILDGQ
jgi:hypothetical protein